MAAKKKNSGASGTLRFEFCLSDKEYAGAWLAEYYRRPGASVLRGLAGPFFIVFGVSQWNSDQSAGRVLAAVAVGYGFYHILRPFLLLFMLMRSRRQSRQDRLSQVVTFDESAGVSVERGGKSITYPWANVSAGKGATYIYFEINGRRATIPQRVIAADREALEAMLIARSTWRA